MPIGLPDEQAGAIPSGIGSSRFASDSPLQRNAGIGEGEQRQDGEGHPGMQALLQLLEQRRLARAFARQRDGERNGYAGQRRVHARLEHAYPDEDAGQQIGRQPRNAASVQDRQHGEPGDGEGQGDQRQVVGVEQRR